MINSKKIFITFFSFFILTGPNVYSQGWSFGSAIGLGTFSGNFPTQTTLSTKIYIQKDINLSILNALQFSLNYSQKIQKFLPGNYKFSHYAYHYGLGIMGITSQQINNKVFLEEGIGLIYQKDKSFEYLDNWNFGILFNIGVSTFINNKTSLKGNVDYGITINNTTFSYINFLFGIEYKL